MATKDWKKIRVNRWRDIKTRKVLVIGKLDDNFTPNKYDVYISGYRWNTLDYFKTKSKALAYAKAYMRKH